MAQCHGCCKAAEARCGILKYNSYDGGLERMRADGPRASCLSSPYDTSLKSSAVVGQRAMQDAFIHLFVNIILLLALICMLRMNTVS